MARDDERRRRTAEAIQGAGLAAVVCGLPSNVLLVSGGYWPTVGTSLAVAAADGRVAVVVPEDEAADVAAGFADVVRTFAPGSLDDLRVARDAVVGPLAEAVAELGLGGQARWGYEHAAGVVPGSYVAVHGYRTGVRHVVREALPGVRLARADGLLAGLRATCTPMEVERVRAACGRAEAAFDVVRRQLRSHSTEAHVAAMGHVALTADGDGRDGGFLAVMSGPRSAKAAGAFARSSAARLARGELALVHCNNQVGGYWTDVTRTFCLGRPTADQRRMYDAVFAARAAALAVIRPGARAADVDAACRSTLAAHGYGDGQFKHATGHGVPFTAISAAERPRVHPKSPDVLAAGNVFNVEPAVYFDGVQGLRQCDLVAVTEGGAEVLTPWLGEAEQLWL